MVPLPKPATAHLEGDTLTGRVTVATSTTSTDPVARLLAVPAAMTFDAQFAGPAPAASGDGWRIRANYRSGPPNQQWRTPPGASTWTGNPLVNWPSACRVGETCTPIAFELAAWWSGQASPPTAAPAIHWTVDLTVYSFTDVPVIASTQEAVP
jgi:hypothetical protein